MASSLGGAFGVAISAAVYGAVANAASIEATAAGGVIVNVIFGILSIFSIVLMVSKNAGKEHKENVLNKKAG